MKTYTLKLNEKQFHTILYSVMYGITQTSLHMQEKPGDEFYRDMMEKLQDSKTKLENSMSDQKRDKAEKEREIRDCMEHEKRTKDEYRGR